MSTVGREKDREEWASQLLSELCEDVSFSEEDWRFRLRICDIWSTTGNYDDTINKSLHSGSSSEGLSADILGSDTDVMHVVSVIKVIESDVVSADEEDDVYKAITSNHPAFYMMNPRHEGKGLHCFNSGSRQCLKKYPHSKIFILNWTILKTKSTLPGCDEGGQPVQHGPALTVTTTGEAQHEFDIVISLHCPSWPTVSEEWKHRLKLSGWSSPELVEKVTKLGCEFVATGNPLSSHKDIAWRLSSLAAERVLVRSFNIVQIQRYIMLWQVEKTAKMYQIIQAAKRQLENNCDVNLSSCRLKLATFYYRLGQVHKCIRVVNNVLEKFTTRTVVLTGGPMREIRNTNVSRVCQHLIGLVLKYDDFHDLLRNVSVPVVFSPWEIINAPPAVQRLAFHRRFESDHERSYFKVVAIDSRVYAYYLMTISYREIGRHVQAERSLNYLRRMLRRPGYYKVCYPYEAQQLFDHCTRSQ